MEEAVKEEAGLSHDFSTAHTNSSSLLGGPATLTVDDLAQMAQTSSEEVREFWVAMGFPSPRAEKRSLRKTTLGFSLNGRNLLLRGLLIRRLRVRFSVRIPT